MSGPEESNGRAGTSGDDPGVLAKLPRTRPQRATARRAAARTQDARATASENGGPTGRGATATAAKPRAAAKPKASKAKAAKAKPAKAGATGASRRSRKALPKGRVRAVRDEVPRQGFESEDDRATGAVQPPGGTEFVGTAAEIVTELAKAGVSGGERLLRDVLSRLGR